MIDLYSEILKMSPAELYQDEFYSIPLSPNQLNIVMDLIAENGHIDILENIRMTLREDYEINYVPFYEKTNDLSF